MPRECARLTLVEEREADVPQESSECCLHGLVHGYGLEGMYIHLHGGGAAASPLFASLALAAVLVDAHKQ
jgi:hypothetical protein